MLNKSDLLNVSRRIKTVRIDALDGDVLIKQFNIAESLAYEKDSDGLDDVDIVCLLVSRVLVNESGESLLTPDEVKGLEQIVVEQIIEAAKADQPEQLAKK